MNEIRRQDCKLIRNAINAALVEVGNELGLDIRAGNASYDSISVRFKVECICAGADKRKVDFEADAYLYHLPESAYKAEFTYRGTTWILEGLKTRSPKYPIIASKKGQSGKYKLPEKAIDSLKKIPKAEVTNFVPRAAS